MADKFPAQLFVTVGEVNDDTGEVEYYNTDANAEKLLLESEEQEIGVYTLVGIKKGQLKAVFSE